MLLKVYELIMKLQAEIGNDAEVRLSARDGVFEIRVDWWEKDFHARRQYSELELAHVTDDDALLAFFCGLVKIEYDRKVKAG